MPFDTFANLFNNQASRGQREAAASASEMNRVMTRGGKFYVLWLAALAFAVCLCVPAGPDESAAAARQGKARRPARPSARVKSLFKQNCARCHGTDGTGRTLMGEMMNVPNFTYAWWQDGATEKRMTAAVTHGRGQMPAFGNKLSRTQIRSLVGFVRAFKQEPARR
jgi:mono/diheme cytochrome c family protein